MPAVTVVADDLTGANATGAGYARRGLRTVTVPAGSDAGQFADSCDVLVIDTASRHLPADEAAARVREAVAAGGTAEQFVKRIDTTLRGNVGAEAAALLEAVAGLRGEPVRGLVVPAFPASGRTTVGGLHLVNGVPLAESDAASDPLSPVTQSRVARILRDQAGLPVVEVHLDTVTGDPRALEEALAAVEGSGVVDATADHHLRTIAAAAARVASRGGPPWVSIDSGPFGAALASALGVGQAATAYSLLAVVGSVTALTSRQVAEVVDGFAAEVVEVDLDRRPARGGDGRGDGDGGGRGGDGALGRLLAACERSEVTVLRPRTQGGQPVPLPAEDAHGVPAALGELAREALARGAASGLYLTGGDTTAGVLEAIGARGLTVEEEVLPLAVAGRLIGGSHDGLPVVTKGGLIGSATAAVTCLEHLRMRVASQPPVAHAGPAERFATAGRPGHREGPTGPTGPTHSTGPTGSTESTGSTGPTGSTKPTTTEPPDQ